ncbi:MAG: hypothetical protein AYP45_14395 [Candidatus Brocadia carolinensis]|uniref:Uncharacterized protein n=1 Tax=Candidatus Brocadia carolinensis TaxID=1004156 RepID=A0A1V4AQZ8_9BACT|nr:MAG: hypothetical protein AYP45_14395 [Candidatus Brocadia caroliniensis]
MLKNSVSCHLFVFKESGIGGQESGFRTLTSGFRSLLFLCLVTARMLHDFHALSKNLPPDFLFSAILVFCAPGQEF